MLSSSSTRYLLAIYELSNGGAAVRSVDIANLLQVSRASVVKCLKKLVEEGLIQKEYYGNVQFMPLGVREANRIYTEYTLLFTYFSQGLRLSTASARNDAIAALCYFSEEGKEVLMQRALKNAGCASPNRI